jgi:hypothetical protein
MRQAATTAEAEAVAAAASLGTDTGAFLDQAWAAVGDLKKVSALYQQVATANPAVALVLARFERMMGGRGDESGMALRGLLEEDGVVLTAPLLLANLAGGARMQAAARLVMLGDARGVPRMREALADAPERSWQAALWAGIAHWGSDADRAEARAQQRGEFDYLTAELARQGDEAAGAALGRALDAFVDRWDAGERMSSSDYEPVRLLLGMIHDARPAAAIPALVRACVSPLVVGALAALAAQGPAGAAAAAPSARALLADVRGPEDDRMWAYRLAAQVALSAAGEAPTELDTARAALTRAHLRRYGYPKVDDLRQIHLLAARLLLDHGDEVDRTEVARLATADHQQLRQLGLAAYDRLGRPRPTLRYCDPARVAWEQAQHGSARLRELLADPGAVWPHFVAKALAASDDDAGRAAALDWAFAVVGAARPYPISYLEASDLGEEVAAAVGVVKQLVAGDEAGLARVRALAHPWLDQAVLGSKPAPRAAEALGQADAIGAVVRRIDRVPFVLGKHINGLALDADGRRLAVVGDGLGVIVDAVTGAVVTELALRYSWGYDAAWAPPGAGADALVVAYHGGHLVEFDPATGVARRELPGFGGVPNAGAVLRVLGRRQPARRRRQLRQRGDLPLAERRGVVAGPRRGWLPDGAVERRRHALHVLARQDRRRHPQLPAGGRVGHRRQPGDRDAVVDVGARARSRRWRRHLGRRRGQEAGRPRRHRRAGQEDRGGRPGRAPGRHRRRRRAGRDRGGSAGPGRSGRRGDRARRRRRHRPVGDRG